MRNRTTLRRLAPLALMATLVAAGGLSACSTTGPYDGPCTGADALTGTTIVIDFQELDGNAGQPAPTIVRCSPNPDPGTPRTGIQALQDAGIPVEGTARWGLGFVCRLNDRPTATEALPITANPSYTEACVNTPPTAAHWGYWWADGTGTTWSYASLGAANRTVVPGGFEGWSFALDSSASTNPAPGVTPRNPLA